MGEPFCSPQIRGPQPTGSEWERRVGTGLWERIIPAPVSFLPMAPSSVLKCLPPHSASLSYRGRACAAPGTASGPIVSGGLRRAREREKNSYPSGTVVESMQNRPILENMC